MLTAWHVWWLRFGCQIDTVCAVLAPGWACCARRGCRALCVEGCAGSSTGVASSQHAPPVGRRIPGLSSSHVAGGGVHMGAAGFLRMCATNTYILHVCHDGVQGKVALGLMCLLSHECCIGLPLQLPQGGRDGACAVGVCTTRGHFAGVRATCCFHPNDPCNALSPTRSLTPALHMLPGA